MERIIKNMAKFRHDANVYKFWRNVYNWEKLRPEEKREKKESFFKGIKSGMNAPAGWLLCQGQAVSCTTYATLFSGIGIKNGK